MHVDLMFPIMGHSVPADHGYALYGALSRRLAVLHPPGENTVDPCGVAHSLWSKVAVHPINGHHCGGRRLMLDKASRLRVRVPSPHVALFMPLTGKTPDIDDGTFPVRKVRQWRHHCAYSAIM